MNGPEHYAEAERLLQPPDSVDRAGYGYSVKLTERTALAQVHAALAQAAATERLAAAVENLPTYEGMLAVYQFGGGRS